MDTSYLRTINWKPRLIGAGLVILGIAQIYYLGIGPYFDIAELDSLIVGLNFLILRSYFLVAIVVITGIFDIVMGIKAVMGDETKVKISVIVAACSLLLSLIFISMTYSFLNSIDFILPEEVQEVKKKR